MNKICDFLVSLSLNCSFKWACLMYVGCMRNYLLRAGVFIVIWMMWLWLWCPLSMSHNPKIKSTNNFCTKSPLHYMSCYSQPTINGPEWIDKNYKSKSNFTLVFKYNLPRTKTFSHHIWIYTQNLEHICYNSC